MITTYECLLEDLPSISAQPHKLVYVYGDRRMLTDINITAKIQEKFPNGNVVCLSTAGHYHNHSFTTQNIVINAINFEKTDLIFHQLNIEDFEGDSFALGEQIISFFNEKEVKAINLIADGSLINGDDLLDGINKHLSSKTTLFGGMAGDGFDFEETITGLNQEPKTGNVIAIGLKNNDLQISVSVDNGWRSYGLKYKITKSYRNELQEIDGQRAYDVLKDLLKPETDEDFTKNTLYFPFQLIQENKPRLVRTPLAVNHEEKSLVYAGDMPEGAQVKIMKAGTINLLNAVQDLGERVSNRMVNPDLIMFVSCVGRRAVLNKLIDEEILELRNHIPSNTKLTGFYSYGEFSQFKKSDNSCYLHNQTLTVTALKE